jgi:hypothetical protein
MDIKNNWSEIRKHFNRSFRSNFYVSLASVNTEDQPTVTPIGSLFLNQNQTGFYFEKYPTKIPLNVQTNPKICVLAVNSNTWFWLKSLFSGKFQSNPAIKLYGTLGERRKATEIETNRLNKRMRATRGLKGNTYLWNDMLWVRDITFLKAEKINLGTMTQ